MTQAPAALSGGDTPQDPSGDLVGLITSRIRDVPDYPRPGVLFKDITPLLAEPEAFSAVVDALARPYLDDAAGPVDKVAGIEARGFILAAPVALRLGAGFVPVRKKGKLPAATHEESYDLEYGSATIEVHTDAFAPGDRILLVDDVLATGGTARAAASLVAKTGADLVGIAVLMELSFLNGRDALPGIDLRSLLVL